MNESFNGKPDKEKTKLIAGFLASALDIEDDMSRDFYGEFLDRKAWPPQLEDKPFQIIKDHLNILIQETEGHIKAFSALKNQLDNNASRK